MEHDTELRPSFPKTYYDNESRRNSNFFFVSYSHKDREMVFDVLYQLYDASVNYWYDNDLDPGDVWNVRVEKIMQNEHCHGAILFLSADALISDAVRKEIKVMEDISKTRSFRIIPVIIGYENPKELILSVADKNDDFYDNGYALFKNITKNGIWLRYDDAVDRIVHFSDKENVKDGYARSFLPDLTYISQNGSRSFLLGKYPSEEDGVPRDIEWTEVCNKGDLYYFISKYCLDFTDEEDIGKVIEKIKQTMSDITCVEELVLINEDFLNNYSKDISNALPTNYADRNRQQLLRLFWVLEDDGKNGQAYALYNSNNRKIVANIQRDRINAGLRLILVINNNKIGERKNAQN